MTNSVINKLETIQQSLYEQAFSRAKAIMFGTSRSLKDYYKRFENDLPSGGEIVGLENICHEIHEKSFILCGDFHTLKQSQRGFLRLIKAYLNNYKNKEVIIALEAFRAINQNHLDQYLSGELSEANFLDLIEYNKYWDFPWPNFKMLLDFAKIQKIKIFGINSDRGGRDNIFSRDRFVANQLNALHKEYPKHKIFCLIGELHLSQQHLPSFLLRRSKASSYNQGIVRILFNVDKYYHGLSNINFTKSSEYLQIKKNLFCILNSPPWMKWQSFNMWQEMHFIRKKSARNITEADEEESDYLAEYFDIDSHFLNITSLLAGFFELDLKTIDLYDFNVFTGDSGELEEYLRVFTKMPARDRPGILKETLQKGSAFLPQKNTILLSKVSINNISDAAGRFLHKQVANYKDVNTNPMTQFYARCITSAIGMLTSKIINPRRKCLLLEDFQNAARKKSESKKKDLKFSTEFSKLLVRHDDWMKKTIVKRDKFPSRPLKSIYDYDKKNNHQLSHAIGQIIGQKIYTYTLTNVLQKYEAKLLFDLDISDSARTWDIFVHFYSIATSNEH